MKTVCLSDWIFVQRAVKSKFFMIPYIYDLLQESVCTVNQGAHAFLLKLFR